jgi:branched-subunit amino acid transport protein AzlD
MLEIIVGAIANLLTRFLPFIFLKKHYKKFLFLKNEFPIVLLTILTLYMIFTQNLEIKELEYKLIGIGISIFVHIIFRKFLLSVFAGSFVYIFLINKF